MSLLIFRILCKNLIRLVSFDIFLLSFHIGYSNKYNSCLQVNLHPDVPATETTDALLPTDHYFTDPDIEDPNTNVLVR